MTTCKYCDGQCACHISPPCSFHTSHVECDVCGEIVCVGLVETVTNMSDGSKLDLCPDCMVDAND